MIEDPFANETDLPIDAFDRVKEDSPAFTLFENLRVDISSWVQGEGRDFGPVMQDFEALEEHVAALESDRRVTAALYYFAGWLTRLRLPVIFGAMWNAAPAADLVDKFCKANDLPAPNMFEDRFNHPEDTT